MLRQKKRQKAPKYKFHRTWAWPKGIENFIRSKIEGYSLHVCCGESELGDVKVDKYVERKGVTKADAFDLPEELKGQFDTVICDPPWELPYHLRFRLLYNLRDCLKPGGKLIFNAFWWPKTRGLKVEEFWIGKPNATWRNVSLLIIARRVNEKIDSWMTETEFIEE